MAKLNPAFVVCGSYFCSYRCYWSYWLLGSSQVLRIGPNLILISLVTGECHKTRPPYNTTTVPWSPFVPTGCILKFPNLTVFADKHVFFGGGDLGAPHSETSPTQSTSNTSCPLLRVSNMAKENLNLNVWRNGRAAKPSICDWRLLIGKREPNIFLWSTPHPVRVTNDIFWGFPY